MSLKGQWDFETHCIVRVLRTPKEFTDTRKTLTREGVQLSSVKRLEHHGGRSSKPAHMACYSRPVFLGSRCQC